MDSQISVASIRQLLLRVQSEEVNEAQDKLRELSQHKQFFNILYSILSNPQEEEWVKTMAASVLNQQFSEKARTQTYEMIYQGLVKVLLAADIKQIDKRIFQKSIINFLQQSPAEYRQKWLGVIGECLKNRYFYDPAYLLIACIAVADIPPALLEALITQTYEPILVSLQVTVDNANLLNQMLKMWIVIIDKLLIQKKNRLLLQQMISSQYLFQLIDAIYSLHACEGTLLCLTPDLQQLNFLKYEAAQLNKRMLSIEIEKAAEGFPLIIDFTRNHLVKMVTSLSLIAPKRHAIDDLNCEDLVTTLLSITRLYLTIKPEQFKYEDVITLQNHIIFPLLAADDTEKEKFEESPEDFNSLTEDCCDKQIYGTLKAQTAKLLQSLGDKVEGTLKYAINRAIQSLQIRLSFIQSYSSTDLPVLETQTALLVLSIFSYGLSYYTHELSTIKTILTDQRTRALPPLQLSRVFTFLAYNYGEVFRDPAEGEGWLSFAISYRAHPTTSYCAFDCFSNIVQDYFNEAFLDKLTDQISIGKLSIVWEIVAKILEVHYSSISTQGIAVLVSKLFLRMEREVGQLKSKEKKDSLDLINCLRTFMNLVKQVRREEKESPASSVKRDFILSKIWPVLDYYKQALQFNIQDQIVKVATEILATMDCVVPQLYPYLNQFIVVFKTNGYLQKVYLKFFNQFFFKADFTRDMTELMKIFVVLKDALLSALSKLADKTKKLKPIPHLRLALCNTLLLIQNAIALFGTYLISCHSLEFFLQVSSMCVRLLPEKEEPIEKTPSGYIVASRALNTLFLCHMHIKTDSIYDYLERLQKDNLFHGYDTKVFAMCVTKQIFNETDPTAIIILLSALARIVESSANKDDQLDKIKKKKKNTIKVSSQMKKIDDFDKLALILQSPFRNDQDISYLLSDMFNKMKQGNEETYSSVLRALPEDILHSYQHFVDFEQLGKKHRVIRKVVGIKQNNPQQQPQNTQPTSQIQSEQEPNCNEDMNNSDEEQEAGLKRRRVKVKGEKKRKLLKVEKKRQHLQEEQQ